MKRQLKDNPEMKQFFDTVDVDDPMDPREAFYGESSFLLIEINNIFTGGRTNCRKMYHKCVDGEEIRYVDVTSLYPYVNKYMRYPVGHPTIITENFEEVTTEDHPYDGLMKVGMLFVFPSLIKIYFQCVVQPPKNLLHPVLPYRSGGKLLFPLCKKCADDRNPNPCDHTDKQRQIKGSWVTVELYKSLEKGYRFVFLTQNVHKFLFTVIFSNFRIVKIIEVYHYDEWEQYDPTVRNSGLFTGYINSFLKTKQEVSAYILYSVLYCIYRRPVGLETT